MMRKLIIVIILLFMIIMVSCTKMIYVPVESVRTEYTNKHSRDSVFLRDSIVTFIKGDTVYKEKYRYLYKDKLVRDSIYLNDTIRVPYPVVETKEVNRLSSFQNFQVWCARIFFILLGIYALYRYRK